MIRAKPETIDDYLAGVAPDTLPILLMVMDTIRQSAPGATERLSYAMPTFFLKKVVVHVGAFKNHIGLFPPVKDRELQDRIAPYRGEKGNLRFPLDQPMPIALINDVVKARAKAAR